MPKSKEARATSRPDQLDKLERELRAKVLEACKMAKAVVEGACNVSGIVHDWSNRLSELWEVAAHLKKGTDWVNEHPVNKLILSQLTQLAKITTVGTSWWRISYEYIEEFIKDPKQTSLCYPTKLNS